MTQQIGHGVMTVGEFEERLLNTEGLLTAALDSFYGEGEWTELDAKEDSRI